MPDDTAPALHSFAPGDRVTIRAEIRDIGTESLLVRFLSGSGMAQYLWVRPADVIPAAPLAP